MTTLTKSPKTQQDQVIKNAVVKINTELPNIKGNKYKKYKFCLEVIFIELMIYYTQVDI